MVAAMQGLKRYGSAALVAISSTFAALAAACSAAPATEVATPIPEATTPASNGTPETHFDPCKSSPPVWREYHGLLKHAKCDQDMFLTMAGVADQLGQECGGCHVPKETGKGFNYPKMTDMKRKALWMDHYFVEGLLQRDGQPVKCKSCHLDRNGKPAVHFLGAPRDTKYAVEWMSTVITGRFVQKDGSPLMCKNCHGGGWGTAEFQKKLILGELPLGPPPSADLFAEPPPAPATPPPSDADVSPASTTAQPIDAGPLPSDLTPAPRSP